MMLNNQKKCIQRRLINAFGKEKQMCIINIRRVVDDITQIIIFL